MMSLDGGEVGLLDVERYESRQQQVQICGTLAPGPPCHPPAQHEGQHDRDQAHDDFVGQGEDIGNEKIENRFQQADLVILDADPLVDVGNLRQVYGVVLGGKRVSGF